MQIKVHYFTFVLGKTENELIQQVQNLSPHKVLHIQQNAINIYNNFLHIYWDCVLKVWLASLVTYFHMPEL